MLSNILGTIWVILGLWWIIRPQALKRRMQRKMNRKIRWIVFGFMIVLGFMMVGSVIRAEGLLAKIVGVAGLAISIKAIMFITSKTSGKMLEWLGERSLKFFRIWAAAILAIGFALIFAH